MTTPTPNPSAPTPREMALKLDVQILCAATLAEDLKRSHESANNLLGALQTLRRQLRGEKI